MSGLLSKLLVGDSMTNPIEAIGNVFDKLFTSDEERAEAEAVLKKLQMHPAELQVELNKIEAQHRSVFVAGWRPFIGWICGTALAYVWIVRPILIDVATLNNISYNFPDLPIDYMIDLVIALLGLGGLRTYEKINGKTK